MPNQLTTGPTWNIDDDGFLLDPTDWSEEFARRTAPTAGITGELTAEHWAVIHAIRTAFEDSGRCPLVFHTCRATGLPLPELRRLFPAGYMRGACRLAGLSYRDGSLGQPWQPLTLEDLSPAVEKRTYRIDAWGFLMDPSEWDEAFATTKAHEMKLAGGLTGRHFQVIRFLRDHHQRHDRVPTVYETCDAVGLTLEDLEALFPDGYHRGAVKLAGLKLL